MTTRHILMIVAVVLTAALPAAAPAQEGKPAPSAVTLVRVFTGWRDGASFKRIAEYFDGKEHTGGETILRTDPAQRTGYYFLVRIDNPGAPRPIRFQLELVEPGSGGTRTLSFPAELPTGSQIFQLGLTGAAWQDPKNRPTAWHLRVLGSADDVLAVEKSYLWEKPAAK